MTQTKIYFETIGQGSTVLLFIHGWLGNSEWWNSQREFFKNQFQIMTMDLPGHGKSEKSSDGYTAESYAEAIKFVANQATASKIILVGHSMAGAYVLEAALALPKVKGIVVVDTLKDLDQLMSYQQVNDYIFSNYRKDFKAAVVNELPKYLFTQFTPPEVKTRLQNEFLKNEVELAIQLLAPLYRMDPRLFAKKVSVPVRAINSDFSPTSMENNRKYFQDYDCTAISECGHYPMLERPENFNHILNDILKSDFTS